MNEALKRLVWERAAETCAYCRLPQWLDVLPFQIDHVIAEQHHGPTVAENLALSCLNGTRSANHVLDRLGVERASADSPVLNVGPSCDGWLLQRYRGFLQFWPSRNSFGTRSLPQILPPARLGFSRKKTFRSAK